jgi:hypothetical protein
MHAITLRRTAFPILIALALSSSTSLCAQQTAPASLPASTSGDLRMSGAAFDLSSVTATSGFSSSLQSSSDSGPENSSSAEAPEAPAETQTKVQQPSPPPDLLQSQPQPKAYTTEQTKRIFGVVPNFRAVGAASTLPPQTVKEKFVTASEDSLDYSSTIVPAFLAAIYFGLNTVPQFGQGGLAFSRYLWHATADQTIENYMVEFVVPVATREDTRYYTLGHGGFIKRTDYALSRAVITRSDSGKETFNVSEIVGAGAAAGISDLYYPAPQRTLSNTAINWTLDVGLDAATFVLREFWPDIHHKYFENK